MTGNLLHRISHGLNSQKHPLVFKIVCWEFTERPWKYRILSYFTLLSRTELKGFPYDRPVNYQQTILKKTKHTSGSFGHESWLGLSKLENLYFFRQAHTTTKFGYVVALHQTWNIYKNQAGHGTLADFLFFSLKFVKIKGILPYAGCSRKKIELFCTSTYDREIWAGCSIPPDLQHI